MLDNVSTRQQPGVIRAYDIDISPLVWNWNSGSHDVTMPIAPIARAEKIEPSTRSKARDSGVEEALSRVLEPKGNQPTHREGHRSAAVERQSSSVVARDLATGAVR